MTHPLVFPDDDGIRPAGDPDACLYCKSKVGEPHGVNCVAVHRKVKVRYTFEVEVEEPAGWDEDQIVSHKTESSWCANNALAELKEWIDKNPERCLCDGFDMEVVEMGKEIYAKHGPGI